MADSIGRISVPELTPVGTFPITSDYRHGQQLEPEVYVHRFGSSSAKREQRFWRGNGVRRYTVQRRRMTAADISSLFAFWDARKGPYEPFTYNAPADSHSGATTAVTARFADQEIEFEYLSDAVASTGVTLLEVPTTSPTYTLNSTLTRFPSAALETALLDQVQTIVPLVHITVNEAAVTDNIFLSDRRVTVGAQLYQERMLDWDGISQGLGGESDVATFKFGNGDRVMTQLANDTDLFRARVEFSLFHVGQGIKLDLWAGLLVAWQADSGPVFTLRASDPLEALTLTYPRRRVSRTCWKTFDDGNACPYTAQGSGGDPALCDKGFATTNGCQDHGMDDFFGGIIAKPQKLRIKDNSQGFFFGFGRPTITSVSLIADSIYGEVLPEIFTDANMPVNAKVAVGSDEDTFYHAVGVVGEGPLGGYATPDSTGPHKIDNQPHHGATESPPSTNGLRTSLGADPNPDFFGLDVPVGDPDEKAAGTAFIDIKRSDQPGRQFSQLAEHSIVAIVSQGLIGFKWTAPGSRTTGVLTNPVWIAVHAYLRARNLEFESAANQELEFDVQSAIDAAAICDLSVSRIIGTGSTTQYKFRGLLAEQKSLRDWLQEILNNCLGYYSWSFGKLRFGVRSNSSAVEAFTDGNILWRSLRPQIARPEFNHLTANFADEQFEYVANSVELYEIDHATVLGSSGAPVYLKKDLNLVGASTKDQAARVISVRLREELGGITAAEWKARRRFHWGTTVLALAVEPGMVVSMTHEDMPGGTGEGRVQSWRLRPDYSIELEAVTTTDSMYDLVSGPKPADVDADPVPGDTDVNLYDVTNLQASEDPFVQDGGTVVSEVTVSWDRPSPLGIFAGANLYIRELDGPAGTPLEEFKFVTSFDDVVTPAARRFKWPVLFDVAVANSGWAEIAAQSFSKSNTTNPLATAPTVEVLLDGQQSAPTAVADIWCQQITEGLRLSGEQPPERDATLVQIADTGSVTPAADGDITDAQVVGTVRAEPGSGTRWVYDFKEKEYTGNSDTTTITLDADVTAKFFPAGAHVVGGTGKKVTMIERDGTVTVGTVVSNTARTITFGAGLIKTGDLRFYLRDQDAVHHLYARFVDTSGNASSWKPVPPTVLDCFPFAPDQTQDAGVVQAFVNGLPPSSAGTYWRPPASTNLVRPGHFWLQLGALGAAVVDTDTDFDTARKHNLNGVKRWQLEVEHSEDGVTSLVKTYFIVDANTDPDQYSNPLIVRGPFGQLILVQRWALVNESGNIPLPEQGIKQIRVRIQNSYGWGKWVPADHIGPGGGSHNPPFFTGPIGNQAKALEAAPVTGVVTPNLAQSRSFTVDLTADKTINLPEYRSDGATEGTGDPPKAGDRWSIRLLRDVTTRNPTPVETWASGYKGLDGKAMSTFKNRYGHYEWEAVSGTQAICRGFTSGSTV